MSDLTGAAGAVALATGPATLRFTTRRLIAIEERHGSWVALDEAWDARPVTVTAFLVWIGTGAEGTEESAMDRLDGVPVNALRTAVAVILRKAFGEAGAASNGQSEPSEPANPLVPASPTPGPTS